MQQINDNRGRWGYDEVFHTWKEIEDDFKNTFLQEILHQLHELRVKSDAQFQNLLALCIAKTKDWIIAKPLELKMVTDVVDRQYIDLLKLNPKFREELEDAYGYDHKKLIKLASWLNVKTCPYCNMHYTLYAKEYITKRKINKMAKFQFDHFYNKRDYPMLSMSLYNLIPSCASCNQGKSTGKIDLAFHPYNAAIANNFQFVVDNPIPLLQGGDDRDLTIELHPTGGNVDDIIAYDSMFHIKALYSRHRDVAREVFARAYEMPYYKYIQNFAFIGDRHFVERLNLGFYPNENEIELRPLTKFQQDLWKQATNS